MSISQCFFCCAPLTLPCRRIKTPAFLFGWAAHQNSRICGIFFAMTREISLAAVRQASGTCGAYLRFIPRKYAPYKFRASSSKNLAASAASRALRSLPLVMSLRSSTKQNARDNFIVFFLLYSSTCADSAECVYDGQQAREHTTVAEQALA